MKMIMALMVLVACLNAEAQTAQSHLSLRAQQLAAKPAVSDTNFLARCAADFRWKDATNKLALSTARISKINDQIGTARKKAQLAYSAGQTKSSRSAEVDNLQAQLKSENAARAAMELKKMKLEEEIKLLARPYATK